MSKLLDPRHFAGWLCECADRKDGYILCTVGQDPKTLNDWYYNQYKDSSTRYKKALYWKEHAQRVFDCQGMADAYVTEMTGTKTNVKARHNYADWCGVKGSGDIPAERRVPGAAVFMKDSYIHHVGYLVEPVDANDPGGDWIVVEARGVMYGVVYTKLSQRAWNRWGWMTKYFDYSVCAEQDKPEEAAVTLRRGMSGGLVAALQEDLIALNYSCGRYGADGEFGKQTESAVRAFQQDHGLEVDGIAGEKTLEKINELLPDEDDEEHPEKEEKKTIQISQGKSWNVRSAPSSKAPVMGYAKRGQMLAESGMKAEGWVGIVWNGEPAWVSEKAVE